MVTTFGDVAKAIDRANALIEIRDYPGALRVLRGVSYAKLPAEQRTLLKLLSGMELLRAGRFADSIQEFLEAAVGFNMFSDVREAAALDSMAYAQSQMGDLEASERNYLKAIDLYRGVHDGDRELRAAHNLAYFYIESGSLIRGLSLYQRYPVSSVSEGSPEYCNYHLNIARAYWMQCRLGDAQQALRLCCPKNTPDQRQRALYYRISGKIQLKKGAAQAAVDLFRRACACASSGHQGRDLLPSCRRWLADAYLSLGGSDELLVCATENARAALSLAKVNLDRWEIAASKRTLAVAASRSDREDESRRLVGEAISMFRLRGSRYELAMTQLAAAYTGLYSREDTDRLLEAAAGYCRAEGVPLTISYTPHTIRLLRSIRSSPVRAKLVAASIAKVPG